ncbi:endonuclease NucS domain-containing protein [Pseudomonadota bacterium]
MAIEHGIWKLGKKPKQLRQVRLESEALLEESIFQDISLLSDGWMLIGRQVRTDFNKCIDLLAIDANSNLVVIELKKHRTARDVVAQTIDYASWIEALDITNIKDIYSLFSESYQSCNESLDDVFREKFGVPIDEDGINNSHQMVIVASKLDAGTERIIQYLEKRGIAINAVFFKVFEDGESKYISRAWMIDPLETQEHVASGNNGQWNGEYYVSYGVSKRRNWDDAVAHGFISAGGGLWYSKTLNMLSKGDRVWVNVPKTGYVGVGEVSGDMVKACDFMVENNGNKVNLLDINSTATYSRADEDDDHAEYVVPIRWLHSVALDNACSEIGFFGNQNSVCKPKTPKWDHTVSRLKEKWNIE